MSFGERIKFRRGELKLSRGELAGRLGVSPSAVSNYENGLSFPKEDVMLRLFDSLETDPNQHQSNADFVCVRFFSAHSIRRTVSAGGPEKAEPDDLHGTACGPSACCSPFHVAFAYRQDKFPVNEVTLSQEFC